ncbi:MAG: hypothetical protein N2043_01655 [Ignavibacterium sp.]|nr:hypothetical protein [Ignavibacterium sp.]
MANVIQLDWFDSSEINEKKRYIYNALRNAIAERTTPKEEMEVISVGPIQLALKKDLKKYAPQSIEIASHILNHPYLLSGIRTEDLLTDYSHQGYDWESFYHPMLAVIAVAVGIKEGLLKYSDIAYMILPNLKNETVKEYLENLHNKKL